MISEQILLSDMNEAEYNPRVIKKSELKALDASISKFGYVCPIIWNKRSKNIVGGHQRYKILKQKKVKYANVSVVDLSPEDEIKLNIVLNSQYNQGTFEQSKLDILLTQLKELNLEEYQELKLDKLEEINIEPIQSQEKDESINFNDNIGEKKKKLCPSCGFEF